MVRVWDVESRGVVRTVLEGHHERVTSVALTAPMVTVDLRVRGRSGIRVGRSGAGTLERRLEGHAGAVNAVALSGDGLWALSGSSDRTVKVWDVSDGGVSCRP